MAVMAILDWQKQFELTAFIAWIMHTEMLSRRGES